MKLFLLHNEAMVAPPPQPGLLWCHTVSSTYVCTIHYIHDLGRQILPK